MSRHTMDGALNRRTFIGAAAMALGGSVLTTTAAAEPTYPPGEAPEPNAEMIRNEWLDYDWQQMPDQPDDALTYFHDGVGEAVVGVSITYVEDSSMAQSVLELTVSQYPDEEVSDYETGPDWADEIRVWQGIGLENRLFIRTENALLELAAARQGLGGTFQSDPDLGVDVAVSIVDSLGEEDIDPEDWWGE